MKLYEAIATIVQEFGKEIVTNAKVINVFSDYNAFEESKTFKVILKSLIAEGYMDQLMYVRDWSSSQSRIISNFIAATSFNEANASYVIQSIAYGLGYTKTAPVYQPSASSQQSTTVPWPQYAHTPVPQPSQNTASYQGIKLDKTEGQFYNMNDSAQRKYKEAAEAYLESIIEFRSDFEKELGIQMNTYVVFDGFCIEPKFEINGRIKAKYDYAVKFYVVLYDFNNRMICNEEIYVGQKRGNFEVADTCISSSQFHKVSNVKRMVVYYELD